ncbi:hypothetical protein Bbelb_153510 [Branchiostoma belcheri]|nr:hypothetical protein Bbelb_153510 [Branchiostoma belcheri]
MYRVLAPSPYSLLHVNRFGFTTTQAYNLQTFVLSSHTNRNDRHFTIGAARLGNSDLIQTRQRPASKAKYELDGDNKAGSLGTACHRTVRVLVANVNFIKAVL